MRVKRGKRSFTGWFLLALASMVLTLGWDGLRLPAPLLMGPMLAGILLALRGLELETSPRLFFFAQGLVGAIMAQRVPLGVLDQLWASWPLFLGGAVWAIATSLVIGALLAHWRVLPGTTALWGVSPGAATAMVLMSEGYGADMRLVAFMQYLRVLLVSFGTVLAGQLALPTHEAAGGTALSRMAWFPSPDWSSFWGTVLLVSVAVVLSHRLKIPGGAVLIPFVSGIALNNAGWLHLELPPWLMAGSYALVGWSIGLRFTMPVLKSVVRALPKILLALISLLAVCALFGWAMVTAGGFDPLTAYLATSPGGVDAVAIIAASTGADIPFVMTMQTVRMLLVFFICPGLMRIFSKKFKP